LRLGIGLEADARLRFCLPKGFGRENLAENREFGRRKDGWSMSSTPNVHLLKRLEGIQSALMAHHVGGTTMPSAVKGSERETFIKAFLEQVFPSPYRFGSGAVTDSTGACSGQLDIVVEYPFLPSFPMPGGQQRLYMAESVALALEVKSDLVAQWTEVENSVQKLRSVQRRWKGSTSMIASGIAFGAPSVTPVPYIAVGYKGYKTLETIKSRMDATPPEKRPDAALVVESGAFVGAGAQAFGPVGLYALCIVITQMFRAVASAESDIGAYVAAHVGEQ
jgi:hypothetical protein